MIDDLLRDKLQTIAYDELLLRALKAVFNERIEKEKPLIEETDNNSLLGEKYRAYETSKQFIEKFFTDLKSYKIDKVKSENFDKEI